jgi:hypothetical protein
MQTIRSLDINPRLVLALADFYYAMGPFHACCWLALEMTVKHLAQLV